MLISACGRARQPHRAADVVDRLMPQARGYRAGVGWSGLVGAAPAGGPQMTTHHARPPPLLPLQAGVQPSVAVWNALLGAYGRAGSVDAAYAAWEKMLDSGVGAGREGGGLMGVGVTVLGWPGA